MCAEEGVGMYRLKERIEGMHPLLSVLAGDIQMYLLGLVSTMRDALDTTVLTEDAGMRVM